MLLRYCPAVFSKVDVGFGRVLEDVPSARHVYVSLLFVAVILRLLLYRAKGPVPALKKAQRQVPNRAVAD